MGFIIIKKLRVDRLIFVNLSRCCAYCRPSLEKSLKLSLAAFSNVFATLAFSRENSFALSLACCIEFFHASIDANSALFANLVAAIVLSMVLLTALA
ncbi:MAG: hypothetical protein QOK86_07290 [Nitrososphaeraceae archaeon]|nr:hypothetical protein [Nitrososphaeraceae archaeon]